MAISAAKQAFLDALAGVKTKINTENDTFSDAERAATVALVNEKVEGVTAALSASVGDLILKVQALEANDADTDSFIAEAAKVLADGGTVEEANEILDNAPTA